MRFPYGEMRISDFPDRLLAKLVGAAADGEALTRSGAVLGTLHYMAPEQIEGGDAVDHRADIFSLGVVIYEMLTGGLPLGRFQPPSQKIGIDVRLDEVVLKALEKDPERRYQLVSEVQRAIEAAEPRPISSGLRGAGSHLPSRQAMSGLPGSTAARRAHADRSLFRIVPGRSYLWLFFVLAPVHLSFVYIGLARLREPWVVAMPMATSLLWLVIAEVRSSVVLDSWWRATYPKGTWRYNAILAWHALGLVGCIAFVCVSRFLFRS